MVENGETCHTCRQARQHGQPIQCGTHSFQILYVNLQKKKKTLHPTLAAQIPFGSADVSHKLLLFLHYQRDTADKINMPPKIFLFISKQSGGYGNDGGDDGGGGDNVFALLFSI